MSEDKRPSRFRFALKHLLFATAVLTFFLAPIPWLGEMYVTALVLSSLMLGLVTRGLFKRKTLGPCVSCLIPLGTGFMLFFSVALALQALLTVIVVVLTIPLTERTWSRAGLCLLVMMGVYGGFALHAAGTVGRLRELMRAYPLETFADQLPPITRTEPLQLSEAVQAELDEFEGAASGRWRSRTRSLQMLHSRAALQFYAAQGFGVTRMMLMRPKDLAGDPLLDESPRLYGHSGKIDEEHLAYVNRDMLVAYFSPNDIGYVQEPGVVAGFQPHALRRQPTDRTRSEEHVLWRVDRLELVGLLRNEEPLAYDVAKVPSMEQLRQAPTRPLTDFESQALPQLVGEKDVVFEETNRGVRMIGSIRAVESCLDCHDAPRGQLLGAFSYDLVAEHPSSEIR